MTKRALARARARDVDRGNGTSDKLTGNEDERQKAPRSEVDASLRDLHSGSKRLPWTRIIFFVTSDVGQREVGIGRGVVYSRGVNGCSGRGIRVRIIAVKRAGVRPGVGVLGKRASGIGRPRKANSGVGSSRSGVGSVCVSGKRRQLTCPGRARASALGAAAKIFRCGPATGPVATRFSAWRMTIRPSGFAVWRAAWLCVACWIGSRDIERVVVGRVVTA